MALAKGAPCVASLRRPGHSRRKAGSFNLGNNLRLRLTHHGMGHPSAAAVARDGRQQKQGLALHDAIDCWRRRWWFSRKPGEPHNKRARGCPILAVVGRSGMQHVPVELARTCCRQRRVCFGVCRLYPLPAGRSGTLASNCCSSQEALTLRWRSPTRSSFPETAQRIQNLNSAVSCVDERATTAVF